ncbi:unnamed protein product [Cuscuta epithymum]|uniref:Reverse transcriptase domain-containing protein n=1 Tax=Cuscuta epithymum TaxID=186058 RepID=A0AAV0EAP6_9ASTE|nr:unnamed protein product [Cuscuta epithymum]
MRLQGGGGGGGGGQYHLKCNQIKISHLIFADDLMLYAKVDYGSVSVLMKCLDSFRNASGLTVSVEKSNVFLAGVNGQMKDDLLALTGFQEGEFPVRYLGIPLVPMRVSVAQYSPLIQKIDGYVAKWKVKSMSYAGRVELIRAVVQDVQSYWLQVFPIHVAILDRIISTCIQFIWDGKSAKVAWCDICKPKEEGGLGLRESKVWNLALIGKTFCNIHSKKDSLWIKWFHGI